jgi:hypothetical protein
VALVEQPHDVRINTHLNAPSATGFLDRKDSSAGSEEYAEFVEHVAPIPGAKGRVIGSGDQALNVRV